MMNKLGKPEWSILTAFVTGCVLCLILPGTTAHPQRRSMEEEALVSTIAFVSTRDRPSNNPQLGLALDTEIYLMDGDGTNVRRLTDNAYGDCFPSIAPNGKTIVFESNRLRAESEPLNTSDLFLMNADGTDQKYLTRGSSATWSPDSKSIAYHASASGTGKPIALFPGAATNDSDIFVINVMQKGARPKNITNNPGAIDDDADWSPNDDKIVFVSKDVKDNPTNAVSAELYVINADAKRKPIKLTSNNEEERAPAWSPDGQRILFLCRRGGSDFEICIMNADGNRQEQLTNNTVADLTASWSPDGRKIVVHRPVSPGRFQLWLINVDGSGEKQLTDTPGLNGFPNWGEIRAGKHR
jgi:Tol biopolymer transport system component